MTGSTPQRCASVWMGMSVETKGVQPGAHSNGK
jgi:hypothetical protein